MAGKTYWNNFKLNLIAIVIIATIGSLIGFSTITEDAEAETLADAFKKLENLKKEVEDLSKIIPFPVGTIMPYAGPMQGKESNEDALKEKGWIFCNGQPLNKKDYNKLYEEIGGAFGADDQQFNVPDLRGRFVRGVDHGEGRDPDAGVRGSEKNGNSGDKVGSIQGDSFKSHFHIMKMAIGNDGSQWYRYNPHDTLSGARDVETEKEPKEEEGQETRPKNIYVNWIIFADNKRVTH